MAGPTGDYKGTTATWINGKYYESTTWYEYNPDTGYKELKCQGQKFHCLVDSNTYYMSAGDWSDDPRSPYPKSKFGGLKAGKDYYFYIDFTERIDELGYKEPDRSPYLVGKTEYAFIPVSNSNVAFCKQNGFPCKVTLNGNGGTWSSNTTIEIDVGYGEGFKLTDKLPTWTGYRVVGWGKGPNKSDFAKDQEFSTTSEMTLYAIWEKDTVTLKLDYNEPWKTSEPTKKAEYTLTYNVEWNKLPNLDENDENGDEYEVAFKDMYGRYFDSQNYISIHKYVFKSWNTKKDGTGKSYKNKITLKEDDTLYAQWEHSVVYPTMLVTDFPSYSLDGYNFLGWVISGVAFYNPDNKGIYRTKTYNEEELFPMTINKNICFYAICQPKVDSSSKRIEYTTITTSESIGGWYEKIIRIIEKWDKDGNLAFGDLIAKTFKSSSNKFFIDDDKILYFNKKPLIIKENISSQKILKEHVNNIISAIHGLSHHKWMCYEDSSGEQIQYINTDGLKIDSNKIMQSLRDKIDRFLSQIESFYNTEE